MNSVAIPQLQIRKPQKAKSPASVGALPSHGPRISEKTTMNADHASTTPPELANRAPIFALEDPAIQLERFTSILSNLTEELFDRARRERGRFDGDVTLRTREAEIDDVEFIVGQVFVLARQIGTATTKALNDHIVREGKGAVADGAAINRLVASLKGGETPMQVAQVATDLARGVAA